jgi:hypothetical protein
MIHMASCHFERSETATQWTKSARPGFQSLIIFDERIGSARHSSIAARFFLNCIACHRSVRPIQSAGAPAHSKTQAPDGATEVADTLWSAALLRRFSADLVNM